MRRVAVAPVYLLLCASVCVGQQLPRPKDKTTHAQLKAGKSGEVCKKEDAQPQPDISPVSGSGPRKETGDTKKGDSQGEPQGWFKVYVLLTGVIAVCSLIATLATRDSANAAKKAADTAEKALKLTERADVLIESAGFSTGQQLTGDTQVILQFKNFGRTRADNATFRFYLGVPDAPELPAPVPTPTVLGAGDKQHVPFDRLRQLLTKVTFERIASGQARLRFYGTIAYTDIFGNSHTVRCSGTYEHTTHNFSIDENRVD